MKYWLPAVLWMAVIFTASSDSGSFQHSSRIIAPVMHWLFPSLSDEAINHMVVTVRKCAHLTEYAILACLMWRAIHKPVRGAWRPWSWSEAGCALMIVALYASSDEIHQIFVPTRGPAIHDVVIDTVGGAAGLLLLRVVRQKNRPNPVNSSVSGSV